MAGENNASLQDVGLNITGVEQSSVPTGEPVKKSGYLKAATSGGDSASTQEEIGIITSGLMGLEKQTPVENLTVEEAAREYLDLVMKLGEDFTNPRIRENVEFPGGRSYENGFSSIDELIKKYGNEAHKKHSLSIDQVINLLDAEIVWRLSGSEIEKSRAELLKINKETEDMGFLKRVFTGRDRSRRVKGIEKEIGNLHQRVLWANRTIGETLNVGYSETGEYSFYPSDLKSNEERSDVLNDRFFSDARKPSIERAIEIRTKILDPTESLAHKNPDPRWQIGHFEFK